MEKIQKGGSYVEEKNPTHSVAISLFQAPKTKLLAAIARLHLTSAITINSDLRIQITINQSSVHHQIHLGSNLPILRHLIEQHKQADRQANGRTNHCRQQKLNILSISI